MLSAPTFQETRVTPGQPGLPATPGVLYGVGAFSLSPSAPPCGQGVCGGTCPTTGVASSQGTSTSPTPNPLASPELPQTQDKCIGNKLWVVCRPLLVGVLLAPGKAQGWRGSLCSYGAPGV